MYLKEYFMMVMTPVAMVFTESYYNRTYPTHRHSPAQVYYPKASLNLLRRSR